MSHRDVIHSIGNTVNNIVKTLHQSYNGDQFVMYRCIESLCYIPEANIVSQLYFNKKIIAMKERNLFNVVTHDFPILFECSTLFFSSSNC